MLTFRSCLKIPVLSIIILSSACTRSIEAPVVIKDTMVSQSVPVYRRGVRVVPISHTVREGDSLYAIAWRYGVDYKDLIKWNDIENVDLIYEGQVMKLRGQPRKKVTGAKGFSSKFTRVKKWFSNKKEESWVWPAHGTITFVEQDKGTVGTLIKGSLGSPIRASLEGLVVYSGSGLKGYGELIIIKHKKNYLSAYAHNKKILVGEGDKVEKNQKIALMGANERGETGLYFELRKDGSPIDPKLHLPKL